MRAAFARAGRKSSSASSTNSKDKEHAPVEFCGSQSMETSAPAKSQHDRSQQVKVKVKSASVESNQTIPGTRFPSVNASYEAEEAPSSDLSGTAGCSSSSSGGLSEKTRAISQERLHQSSFGSGRFLSISPLRPSISTICLFSGSSTDEASKACDISDRGAKGSRAKPQQASSSLISIPTRASLTHEWRKLKTPNKCRECNLLVYFNGRECSMCGFVAHKKCLTVMVIKCRRNSLTNSDLNQAHRQPHKRGVIGAATAPTTSALGVAFLAFGHPNARPFGSLASPGGSSALSNHTQVHHPIFGQSIMSVNSAEVLDFINRFVYEIDMRGLTSKGIYRVSSIKSKVDKLCRYYDQNPSNLIDLSSFHPNIIANALKMYLRKLPEPLLTHELYDGFIAVARKHSLRQSSSKSLKRANTVAQDEQEFKDITRISTSCDESSKDQSDKQPGEPDELVTDLSALVERLPTVNRQLAAIILRHLRRVSELATENQMSAKNLSIIFGPTLLSAGGEHKSSIAIADNIHQARLVELMIDWAYQIFPPSSSSRDQC